MYTNLILMHKPIANWVAQQHLMPKDLVLDNIVLIPLLL